MAITLEEIKKLPPRLRFRRLKEFEEEQRKLKIEEEKKRETEEEEIIKKSIEEITKEEEAKEEEEKLLEKEKEEKKKVEAESLEIIAEEARPTPLTQEQQKEYQLQQEYVLNLSKRPTAELSRSVNQIRESFEQKGYLNPQEINNAQNLRGAFYEKEKSGYDPNERSRMFMSEAEKILDEIVSGRKYK